MSGREEVVAGAIFDLKVADVEHSVGEMEAAADHVEAALLQKEAHPDGGERRPRPGEDQ